MESVRNDRAQCTEINAQHAITAVLFTGDGKQVVSADTGGNVQRWKASNGDKIDEIRQSGTIISAIALSPDRRWLVTGHHGSKSNVQVWNAETRHKVWETKGHTDTVTSLDVSPDSTTLVTGSNDKCAVIWSILTGRRLTWSSLRHDKPVVAVRFSPNGDRLAVATVHKSIRIYDSKDWKQLLDISCPFSPNLSSPLSWSADGCQIYAASYTEVKLFSISSGSMVAKWFVPGGSPPSCIAVSRDQNFIAVVAGRSLSFWDTATRDQIHSNSSESVIEYAGKVYSLALSGDGEFIATGEQNGIITIRSLRDILPNSYHPANEPTPSSSAPPVHQNESSHATATEAVPRLAPYTPLGHSHLPRLPLINVNDTVLDLWMRGELTEVEKLMTSQILNPSDSAETPSILAHRALVRCRLNQYRKALDDAKKSLEVRQSVIGYIAVAIARVRNGEHDLAMPVFDVVLADGVSSESHLLLLIKAIVLFESGRYKGAIERVSHLVDHASDQSPYVAVRAQMRFFLGDIALKNGDNEQAADYLQRAREALPLRKCLRLMVISLIFGWDFDALPFSIQRHIQKCIKPLEDLGDVAMESRDTGKAIERYSRALSLRPSNPACLFVKRSQAQAMLELWAEALKDAQDAIKADPMSPRAYERKHAALHALKRYDEAVDAYARMLSLLGDQDPCREKYVMLDRSEAAINGAIYNVAKTSPFILINVTTGSLCNERERADVFKSEPHFKELISSMTLELDNARIQQVVTEYFEYVTFSHVWEGKEPSFQDVHSVGSIWNLDEKSPLNHKLRSFCEVVREDGYRWAWSDTCCIDKVDIEVLKESLTKMYKWYEASTATFAFLFDVDLESEPGFGLKDCKWMTRAWTNQELLAPKVIRFYDRNWKPYLGDSRPNHKESPEIMQELADAIHIPLETIKTFHTDSLNVREKLRIASTRNATREEDTAYSLIGIFQSDIRPHYGEGADALGHLLEEIVTRSADVTVLAWTGKSSTYNSCLPGALTVYGQLPPAQPAIQDVEMTELINALKMSVSDENAIRFHHHITRLPPARFANRRLYLPCIIFGIRKIKLQDFGNEREHHYRARVPGIGHIIFQTSDRLPVTEPQKLVFVHPWIRDLRDPGDGFTWASMSTSGEDSSDSESEDENEAEHVSSHPLHAVRRTVIDQNARALRLLVRLQQPFRVLLLEQHGHTEFKRVATDSEIVVSNLALRGNFVDDFATEVLEIL